MKPLILFVLMTCMPLLASASVVERDDVRGFIDGMVERHGFERAELEALFATVTIQDEIIELMTRPAERRPWHQYRPIFLTDARIQAGVEFWEANAETLARAEAVYGVPAKVIVAIIGVETFYGRHTGRHRVVDALTTLGFDYPPRADFFRRELEQFLIMAREEGLDPHTRTGSYAGAMGVPQFISSSWRHYAVDFSGNGRRDLIDDIEDAIGSVANYLAEHRWEPEAPIAVKASVSGDGHERVRAAGLRPHMTAAQMAEYGVHPRHDDGHTGPGALIALEQADHMEYWIGWQNFYAITRYNHSPLYAMAVYQLAREIEAKRLAQRAARG